MSEWPLDKIRIGHPGSGVHEWNRVRPAHSLEILRNEPR